MRKRRRERQAQYESPTYLRLLSRLASNIRRMRTRNGWTQEEAALRASMATQVYQRIEAGSTNVTLTTLSRLCDGFEIDMRELWRITRTRTRRGG
ncbi:helix-turn-helix domain-containing protein [Myxococcota bacterium]